MRRADRLRALYRVAALQLLAGSSGLEPLRSDSALVYVRRAVALDPGYRLREADFGRALRGSLDSLRDIARRR